MTALVCLLAALPAAGSEAQELDALLARMATTRGVSARFEERREMALLVEPLESRGALYFVPPDRMARFTFEPAAAALLVEGDVLRLREGDAATELDLSASPMARAFVDNFMVVFSGDRAALEERYRVTLRQDASGWELELQPRSALIARHLEAVLMRGDAEGMHEMELRDADGDRTVTRLVDVDHDRPFSAEELTRLFRDGRPLTAER